MSTTVDERVVEMRFDNKQFEQNIQTSLSSLDKLKKSLNLEGAAKGLETVNDAANKCSEICHRLAMQLRLYECDFPHWK